MELSKGFGPVLNCVIGKHKDKIEEKLRLKHYLKKIVLNPNKLKVDQIYEKPSIYSKYTNDQDKAVLIMTNDSKSNESQDFVVVCDHVVCTTSLGYLKENLNNMIEPYLLNFYFYRKASLLRLSFLILFRYGMISNEKRMAVTRTGFGTMNKVKLEC